LVETVISKVWFLAFTTFYSICTFNTESTIETVVLSTWGQQSFIAVLSGVERMTHTSSRILITAPILTVLITASLTSWGW
jgi:hypothetical protein